MNVEQYIWGRRSSAEGQLELARSAGLDSQAVNALQQLCMFVSMVSSELIGAAGSIVQIQRMVDGRAAIVRTWPETTGGRHGKMSKCLVLAAGGLEQVADPVGVAMQLTPEMPARDRLPSLDLASLIAGGSSRTARLQAALENVLMRDLLVHVLQAKSCGQQGAVVCPLAPALLSRSLEIGSLLWMSLAPADRSRGLMTLVPDSGAGRQSEQTCSQFVRRMDLVLAAEPDTGFWNRLSGASGNGRSARQDLFDALLEAGRSNVPLLCALLEEISQIAKPLAAVRGEQWAQRMIRQAVRTRDPAQAGLIVRTHLSCGGSIEAAIDPALLRQVCEAAASQRCPGTLGVLLEAVQSQLSRCPALRLWLWDLAFESATGSAVSEQALRALEQAPAGKGF